MHLQRHERLQDGNPWRTCFHFRVSLLMLSIISGAPEKAYRRFGLVAVSLYPTAFHGAPGGGSRVF